MRGQGNRRGRWEKSAAVTGLSAMLLAASPQIARAQGFFDFLFGGFQQRPAPPRDVESYAEPPQIGRIAPPSMGPQSVHREDTASIRSIAFCVRLCDGQHFPLEHVSNATPIETCHAMCPAAKTKVFYGSAIDHAVASDGMHYANLESAFLYQKQSVANCTCNGKSAFGLATLNVEDDPTLRPGDIVATPTGFVAYHGKAGHSDAFTPVSTTTVAAELNGTAGPVDHVARRIEATAEDHSAMGVSPPARLPRRQAQNMALPLDLSLQEER